MSFFIYVAPIGAAIIIFFLCCYYFNVLKKNRIKINKKTSRNKKQEWIKLDTFREKITEKSLDHDLSSKVVEKVEIENKSCAECGSVIDDTRIKICPYCGSRVSKKK